MNSNPFISIVTVSYNAVTTIEQTILSVLNQTYSNIEYIIIDGGSTDGTVDIIKKYTDKISYWVSESDKGIYNAMNKGIDCSTGDYILFCNADDTLYSSTTIEECACFIDDFVDVLYGDLIFKYGEQLIKKESKSSLDDFKKYMPLFHPATFVKRNLLLDYKFDESYRIAADYKLLYELYVNNYTFKKIDLVVSIFNAVDGISNKNAILSIKESFKVRSREKWYLWWPKWIIYYFLKRIGLI